MLYFTYSHLIILHCLIYSIFIFCYGLLQDTESSYLYYTVGLFVVYLFYIHIYNISYIYLIYIGDLSTSPKLLIYSPSTPFPLW